MSHHHLRSDEDTDDAVDLMQYVLVIWRYRLAIAAVVILASGWTYWRASNQTPMYEGVTRVSVGGPPERAIANVAGFSALLHNHALAARVVQEFSLDQPPHRLSPQAFLNGTLNTREVQGTNMLDVKVVLSDPTLAAKVVNRHTDLSRELSEKLQQAQHQSSALVLKAQLTESRQRLAEADDALQRYKQKTQIELAKQDVDALLGQRGRLTALIIDIEAHKARLAEAERAIGTQDRVMKGKFARDLGDAMREVDGGRSTPGTTPSPIRSEAIESLINPTYDILEKQITETRTALAGLERERAQLVGTLKLSSPQLAELKQLYTKQAELASLEAQADLFRKIYAEVYGAYAQAGIQSATPALPSVQVVDLALPPASSVTPGPWRQTEIAAAVSLLLSMFGALLFDFGVRYRQQGPTTKGDAEPPVQG